MAKKQFSTHRVTQSSIGVSCNHPFEVWFGSQSHGLVQIRSLYLVVVLAKDVPPGCKSFH